MRGLIFAIEEFAVFDGSGIRVNVFFKGCPLRCRWCHNPEGWEHSVQIVKNPNGCVKCGICEKVCPSPQKCRLCKACIINCPKGLIREGGYWIESEDLAQKLLRYSPILEKSGGGLTFSGGEVLMQADFCREVLQKTASMHRIIETSGYGNSDKWRQILENTDFVYYDLKIMDSARHREYTGIGNEKILENARILFDSNVPCVIRVPFIHGVNTDTENLTSLCEFVRKSKNVEKIEFLQYNELAGAKYGLVGKTYDYSFQKPDSEDIERTEKICRAFKTAYAII